MGSRDICSIVYGGKTDVFNETLGHLQLIYSSNTGILGQSMFFPVHFFYFFVYVFAKMYLQTFILTIVFWLNIVSLAV